MIMITCSYVVNFQGKKLFRKNHRLPGWETGCDHGWQQIQIDDQKNFLRKQSRVKWGWYHTKFT